MSTKTATITVPWGFDSSVHSVEGFFTAVAQTPPVDFYVLDMKEVTFVSPYGVIAIIAVVRQLSATNGIPVQLQNLAPNVHSYLERMNLFRLGTAWLHPTASLPEEWNRNPYTRNLLELSLIRDAGDVMAVASRAEQIFARWLMTPNVRHLVRVLSELCTNIYTHSGDPSGCILIQKYQGETPDRIRLCLAVGDLGCGIRNSLSGRHGELYPGTLDYLNAAMNGYSARPTGRGGLGLRVVEEIVAAEGGYLWLRSDTAAIHTSGPGHQTGYSDLTRVPGTQVAFEFVAALRI